MILTGSTSQMLAMDALAFEKMKSNRRKQRTPIRVAYDPNDPEAPFPKVMPPEEEFANGEGSEGGSDKEHTEEDIKSAKSACNTYPETFPMEEELRKNAGGERHVSKSNEPEDMGVAFPTKYHRLGSELFQENKFMPNGHNKETNGEKENRESVEREIPDRSPNQDDIQNEEGVKVDGSNRIFHPDAYCEICDREFCNKYFLKTHKANKHGIFDNSPSPFSMGTMPPSMVLPEDATSFQLPHPTLLPPSQPTSSSFKVMDFLQSLPATEPKCPPKSEHLLAPKPDKNLPNSDNNVNVSKDDTISNRNTPTSSSILNINGNSNNNNTNNASKLIKDMEDFCELCQKHFCNKYYLKKHKQDVHGITPPEGLSMNKRGRAKDLQLKLDSITSTSGAISTSASPLIPHSIASMAGLPNMPGVMVLNPFMPPMLIPGSLLGQSHFAPPLMPQPLNSSSSCQISPPSSLITTTASQSSPIDALRGGMGGTGGSGKESYCQLCQKEFCNEHFLKIHRANKHGLYDETSPESSRPFDSAAAFNAISKPTANTSETPTSSASSTDGSKDLSKPDSSPKPGTSLVTNSSSQENYATYCNLCNQEFASKYTYRIHRIQVHGMLNEGMDASLTEEIIKNSVKMKEESMKVSPRSKNLEEGPVENRMSENGLTTMFGNMVAAKLADRVTCDICNKDLCNKYFLKVHMFKVHGIEQSLDKMELNKLSKSQYTGESDVIKNFSIKQEVKDPILHSPKLPTSLPLPVLPKSTDTPMDMSSNSSAEKLSSDELVKMGIDPEAYCEICKKEFCSKYFLRTHRLNIHGIRNDKSDSPQHHDNDRLSLNHLAATALNKPLNLSLNGGKSKFGFEKHTWRWKEPVNSSRVSCEICNKELCNKYFLRTHKLRKHGILPADGEKMSVNSSPTTSDIETYSNSSLPTDLSTHDRNMESPSPFRLDNNMSRSNSLLNFEDRKAKIGDTPNFKMRGEEEMSMTDQYYNHYSEVCHLCNRRFKSTKWLKAHIWKDHAGMTAFSPDIKKFIEGFDLSIDSKSCEICKVVFPSELSMQLHMIQEHNAKIALNTTSPTQNGGSSRKRISRFGPRFAIKRRLSFLAKQKFYSCSVCDYKSKWLSNITSHEQSYHDILPKGFKMDVCQPQDDALDLPRRNVETKQYRCKTCNRKFSSAIHCHKHIREEHIRGQNYRVNKLTKSHLSCKFCHFSTRFSKQLRHHMIRVHSNGRYNSSVRNNGLSMSDDFSGNNASQPLNLHAQAVQNMDDGSSYTLQSFQIENRAKDSDFVTAVVKMPVRKHVTDPVSVTFLLTPMDD